LPELGDDWRPDRSGVLILTLVEKIHAGYTFDWAFQLLVLGGEESIRQSGFVEFVMTAVNEGIPTYLAAPGPPGKTGAHAFLNRAIEEGSRTLDYESVLSALLSLYREAAQCPSEDVVLKHKKT
jgi:hypothetical protein